MKRIARALLNYFFKGLIVVVPLGAAAFLIFWAVASLDNALNLSEALWVDSKTGKPMYIPGLGILNVIVVILIAGVLVTNVITDPIKRWFLRWINRLPFFNFLYSSIKDLTEAFVGDDKKFNEAVIVQVNEFGLKKVGFIVQKDLAKLGLPGEVAVYFPLSYSFAGQVVIVPAEHVKPCDRNSADMMKFVISGGVSGLD